MGDKLTDPLEINKDPQLIKDAQAEIGKLDVLVCGECHSVFHYIEQFQEHKLLGKCLRESPVIESCLNEQKPQVWAFMLWKNAKFKNSQKNDAAPSSWNVYQLWCNLENNQKEAWIAAGRNIQSFTKLSTAKVQEVKSKVQPLQPKATSNTGKIQSTQVKGISDSMLSKEEEEAEDDPLEDGEIRFSQLSECQKKVLKAQVEPVPNLKGDIDPLADSNSELDTEDEVEREAAIAKIRQEKKENQKSILKKSILKPVQLNSDVTILPSLKKIAPPKKAFRTLENKKEEFAVEKIISRRYNPGKKTFEYLLKWENCEDDQNTWEPASHLESCKQLLEQFELNLKKQKAQKLANKQLSTEKKSDSSYLKTVDKHERQSGIEISKDSCTTVGRPQRTSKQKALNVVKAWCGSISDADEPSVKRSFSDSDSDSVGKKIKLEPDTSDSDEDQPTIKKLKTSLNGVGKKHPLPENILVPDSQGIVRINQKQLPALSSGVYVMSKTAGIIKLDSNTSKIATSGGHAVIKVAPKIGQTSIKVIKKDSITNGSKSATPQNKMKIPTKIYTPRIIKKSSPTMAKKAEPPPPVPPKEEEEEEESDGIEEMEFPTDLPIPSPDSPPGEFTLCPLTGKIAGQEYPPEEESKLDDADSSIDNIVKIAAANILNDSSKPDSKVDVMVNKPISTRDDVKQIDSEASPNETVSLNNQETGTSMILSTALSNAEIESSGDNSMLDHKSNVNPTQVKEKNEMTRNIINRTIVPKPAPQAIITRITPSPNRNRPFVQKHIIPSTGVNSNQVRKNVRHSYSNKNAVRRIGSTSIYQSSGVEATPKQTIKSPLKQNISTSTSNVMNMPLLTEAEPESTENSHEDTVPTETGELNTISLNESETPLLITGEDGTIYQVAGQNEEGQTILITQGADGQQQCLLVASENTAELTEAVSASPAIVETPQIEGPLVINTEQEVENEAEVDNGEDSQVVAQIVSAQPPSPGGTRKVVLMLPDGNLMMTEVTAEQYAALELDK